MHYVVNTAVVTEPGTYRYRLLTVAEAQDWLRQHPIWQSAIRYSETAEAFKMVVGFGVAVSDTYAGLKPGDEALVFRLKSSIGRARKRQLTATEIAQRCEIGLLTRLE